MHDYKAALAAVRAAQERERVAQVKATHERILAKQRQRRCRARKRARALAVEFSDGFVMRPIGG